MIKSSKSTWKSYRFDEMAYEVKDRVDDPRTSGYERYVGLSHLETGSLKIWRWGSTQDVHKTKFLIKSGDIIFGRRNAYLRRVSVADFDGVCSAHAMVLRAHSDVIISELLPFFMQTEIFWKAALRNSAGSLSPTINWPNIAKEKFDLPPPDEQKMFADILHVNESYITELEKVRRALLLLNKSWLENYMIFLQSRYEFQPVFKLLREPPKNGISPVTNPDEIGYKTVSISAVSNGYFCPQGNIKFSEVEYEKVAPFFVKSGDIFAIRGNGNRYLTGKVGISFENYDDLFYPDLLIRLRFNETKILPRFALAQWNLPSTHRRLISRAKSSNGIWKVNGQDIRAHSLLVPNITEQKQILAKLDLIQTQVESSLNRKAKLNRIKAVILKKLQGAIHG